MFVSYLFLNFTQKDIFNRYNKYTLRVALYYGFLSKILKTLFIITVKYMVGRFDVQEIQDVINT